MSEEQTREEVLKGIVELYMPFVMEDIMADTELNTQRKASLIGLANSALHQLRLLRGALET